MIFVILITDSCKKEVDNITNPPATGQLPTVSTSVISNITTTSATCGGNVLIDGGTTVTARGVCWSKCSTPTITNSITIDGAGVGSLQVV